MEKMISPHSYMSPEDATKLIRMIQKTVEIAYTPYDLDIFVQFE